MDTIFMKPENSKASDPHRLLLNLSNKVNLTRSDKYVALWHLSIYYTWKNIKKPYKNNNFKISAATLNEEFELTDASHYVADIQDYFDYIIKKHEKVTDHPSIMMYVYKIENRVAFKVKKGYRLEL